MPLIRITDAAELLTLADAKLHLRVDHDDDDTLITSLIQTARSEAEHRAGIVIGDQTWRLEASYFPLVSDPLVIGLEPVTAITSIDYIDTAGVDQTLPGAAYSLKRDDLGRCVVALAYGTEWPSARLDIASVRVTVQAGYTELPPGVRDWMKLAIGTWYGQREGLADNRKAELPRAFWDGLLDRVRVYS